MAGSATGPILWRRRDGGRVSGGGGTICYQGRIMTSLASRGSREGHAAIQYLNRPPSILSSTINCCGEAKLESPFLGLCGFSFDGCESRLSIRGSVERMATRPHEYDPRYLIQSKVYLASFSVLKPYAPPSSFSPPPPPAVVCTVRRKYTAATQEPRFI